MIAYRWRLARRTFWIRPNPHARGWLLQPAGEDLLMPFPSAEAAAALPRRETGFEGIDWRPELPVPASLAD